MNTNIFAIATKNKFRYPYKGLISTEDLWDLNLDQLDSIYKTLMKDAKDRHEDSLLTTMPQNDGDTVLEMEIEIVKYIFDAKVEAARRMEAAVANEAKKRRILEVLAKKQDDSLNNMSEDELREMLNELG